MKLSPSSLRWTLAALLIAAGTVTLAPMAHADRFWHRWRRVERVRYGRPSTHLMLGARWHDHEDVGPVFAGVLGGVILGAIIAHDHPVVVHEREYAAPPTPEPEGTYAPPAPEPEGTYAPPAPEREREHLFPPQAPVYRYEDGNGERWWDTLDECTQAARGYHGPHVIHVVDDKTNETVRTLFWKHDHWISDQDRDGGDD